MSHLDYFLCIDFLAITCGQVLSWVMDGYANSINYKIDEINSW